MNRNIRFWLGETDKPIVQDRSSDFVMDSVINYYSKEDPKLPYTYKELFLDNGAFTSVMQGTDLDLETVIKIQTSIWPDKTIPLDYPSKPEMSPTTIRKNWEKTKANIVYWQESTTLKKRLVAPLHAWDKASLKENVTWLAKNADTDLLAIGSVVDLTRLDGFFGDRQPRKELIDLLSLSIETIKRCSDFEVHIMGLGSSPLMLHLAYYLGADSTDSSGPRRKAAYGKIVLPGTGERYTGNSSAKFGMAAFSENDMEKLRDCDCSVCRVNQDRLWIDWKARAIHNEYVMKFEAARARVMATESRATHEAFLDDMFEHSSLSYLWEYTKLRVNYDRISDTLFAR